MSASTPTRPTRPCAAEIARERWRDPPDAACYRAGMSDEPDYDPKAVRVELERRRAELVALDETSRDSRGTVTLDQQSVGRLSRMDALQGQAMARAGQARAEAELQRIAAALRRLDGDDYGYCLRCDEPVAAGRLEADPSATLCIHCAEHADRH